MKKCRILSFLLVMVLILAGCVKNEADADENYTEEAETEEVQTENNTKMYSLLSEVSDDSIEIGIPEEFQETEYLSDTWLALEIPGDDEESSTQLMMYLNADVTIDIEKSIQEEINYLLSANLDEWEPIETVQNISSDNREWFYLAYELEGLEGYKMWTELESGSVLVGTIENIGSNPKAVDIEKLILQIDGTINAD